MFFDSAAVEIPEKIFCGTFKKAGFEAGPFWELAGRVGPPLPPPSLKGLDWRGFCKMCLQNLERLGVRGQNLENTRVRGSSSLSPHTANALAMICSLACGRQGQMSHGLSRTNVKVTDDSENTLRQPELGWRERGLS